MSIEVRPVGVTCNLRCEYCYEEKTREETGRSYRYDKAAVFASIDKLKDNEYWSLFGGEALILTLPDLEELLAKCFDKHKRTGIQTNGTLITDAHLELFCRFQTQVGVSVDGPDELNDSRWAGTVDATRALTIKSHSAIEKLCALAKDGKLPYPGLIVTLHAGNCSPERFPRFLQWLRELDEMGITNVNFHVMEMDHRAHTLFLPQEELADRLIDIWRESESFTHVRPLFIKDVLDTLKGDNSHAVCVYRACDPLNTQAVHGIEHDGAPSGCNRLQKDGIAWLPAEGTGRPSEHIGFRASNYHIRQIALYQTPQEYGGCQGCEYWLVCQGNCSGEGVDGDWRKRSSYCQTYKKLLGEGAKRLRAVGAKPIPDWNLRPAMEEYMMKEWVKGNNPTLKQAHEAAIHPPCRGH